jgi:lipooligosaccharide transport system ATP-binding protein
MTGDAATEPAVVIAARGLRKQFGALVAVDGIDFEVRRGECFGFLGPNGAGKTTTMRMIYRASPVGGGSLTVCGFEAADGRHDRDIKERVGVIPQETNVDLEITVRENLEIFARFYRLAPPAAQARITELSDFFGLNDKLDAKVETLSGGFKRRMQIARGLLGDPEVLVLDEPTTGLDPQARQHLWERLNALKRRQATLLLSTHYLDEAQQLCDRLVVIDRGTIVAQGTPGGLIAEHVSSHVVEVRLDGDGVVPEAGAALRDGAVREEVLSDRWLLYTNDGERLIAHAAHLMPDRGALLRRANLEDVFLKITGRGLGE